MKKSLQIIALQNLRKKSTLSRRQRRVGYYLSCLIASASFVFSVPAYANTQLTLNATSTNQFGYGFNGTSSNYTEAEFDFTGSTSDLTLTFDAYDIDTSTEIEVILNGQLIGYADKTSNNSIGSTTFAIPASLQAIGTNTLEFVQTTPGWIWGVTNLLLASDGSGSNTGTTSAMTIRINEFLASNDDGLKDEDGDESDWIEIYNYGSSPVELEGIYLSDEDDYFTLWPFPEYTLQSGEHLVVFASGKDRSTSQPYHTNFKLKSGGEYLGLIDADGITVIDEFSPEYPTQYEDISYGVTSSSSLGYFDNTTPNDTIGSSSYAGIANVEFSEERGFYTSAFELSLSSNDPTVTIRYTTDGTEPSVSVGTVYTGPIQISTTTPVRAYAYKSNYLHELPVTHTYLFLADVVNQPASISGYPNKTYSLGSGSATAIHDHQMDPAITENSRYTADLLSGLKEIPTVSLAMKPSTIFDSSGFYDNDDVEMPVSVEIMYGNGEGEDRHVNAGIESHSHNRLKRSMRLNFRSDYGYSDLKSDIMETAPVNGLGATDDFDRLILRGGNNRAWTRNWNTDHTAFTIDQFNRDTQIAVSGYGVRGNFVHVYINGIYWGMHNIVERPDDKYLAEYFGGDDDDWFYIKHSSSGDGPTTSFNFLTNDLLDRNLSTSANYELIEQYIDVDKFIDYLLVQWYASVSDWPQNNFYGGMRDQNTSDGLAPFRYFAWDAEWSWDRQRTGATSSGQARVPSLFQSSASVNSTSPLIARFWHALRQNSTFMSRVSSRVDSLTAANGALSDSASLARWNTLNAYIENAVVAESARWGDALQSVDGKTRTRDNEWQSEVDEVAGFINGNAQALKNALSAEGYY